MVDARRGAAVHEMVSENRVERCVDERLSCRCRQQYAPQCEPRMNTLRTKIASPRGVPPGLALVSPMVRNGSRVALGCASLARDDGVVAGGGARDGALPWRV